ncbi:MAG: hypothetical protein WB791_02375 [Waddliaceae bacterium]
MSFQLIFLSLLFLCRPLHAQSIAADQQIVKEPGAVIFRPPTGWRVADSQALPPRTQVMVVGPKEGDFPPSINLSTEKFDGSLKDYLKIIKEINDSQQSEWKDLGKIRTKAGEASLSQTDAATEWGVIRMMHAILLKNGVIHILTAAALKMDFPKHYKEFFESLRSLQIHEDPDQMAEGNLPSSSDRKT